jgi:hypothetical protein
VVSEDVAELSGTRSIVADDDTNAQYNDYRSWNKTDRFRAVGNDWSEAEGFSCIGLPRFSEHRTVAATEQISSSGKEKVTRVPIELDSLHDKLPQGQRQSGSELVTVVLKDGQKLTEVWRDETISLAGKLWATILFIEGVMLMIWTYFSSSTQKQKNFQEQDDFHERAWHSFEENNTEEADGVVVSRRVIRPPLLETLGVAIAGGLAAAVIGTLTFFVVQLYGPS